MKAQATTHTRQTPQHATWFTETQALYNRVVAFHFEVIQAHADILEAEKMLKTVRWCYTT